MTGQSEADTDKKRNVGYTSANSPRVGVSIQPVPWLSFYGNYTRSYGSSNGVSAQGTALPAQVGVQFEGGAKAELLDGQLTATIAYFDIEKKNMTRAIPNSLFVQPIGLARSNGVELDVNGRIDENWSVIANFSHLDARIIKDEDAKGSGRNTGRRLASVPHNMANLWMKYEASGELRGLALGGGVTYNDKQFGDDANSFELPAYARVDLMASYKFQALALPFAPNLTFQVNVTNLLGTTYYEGATSRYSITPGAPRAFLASVRAEF
jgi:iron complex outermembrane recepter protein